MIYNIATQECVTVSQDTKASEPRWLDENQLVWLKDGENGNTSFIVADADGSGKTYTAGTVAGPVSNIKLHVIEPGMVAIAVAGKANPDGSLHNPKDTPKSYTTGKLYDATFVRHWDSYVTKERNSIFTAILKRAPARVQGRDGRFSLIGFTNALKGTGLECPIPPFGGTDHFDIGRDGLAIVAKDPDLNPATHTKCNAYWIRKADLIEFAEPRPIKLRLPGYEGAATSPVVSDSGVLAFLQMRTDGYESDQNHIIRAFFPRRPSEATGEGPLIEAITPELYAPDVPFNALSPSSLMWTSDPNFLYAQAEYQGAGCLFSIPLTREIPISIRQLTHKNYIIEVAPIPKSPYLLLSSNSLVDNSIYSVLNPYTTDPPHIVPQNLHPSASPTHNTLPPRQTLLPTPSHLHSNLGLSPTQISSIWYPGANSHPVHALVLRPSFFDPKQNYPLAYLIHGGPQGAWNDQWSTRWNAALFAEQGYVVIMPNPTGSTGYGQQFTDAITKNWGGDPYEDLVKGIEYIEENLNYVDTSRMVALGASYGGYMINWIAGHPLASKFKSLVCHDGVFSMAGQLASEEQYFPAHDFGAPYYSDPSNYTKYDPARFANNWKTPMLIIHSDLDYRLTVSEGLSAFNVCQGKGIESRFLTFSDEGHWVLREENSLVWWLVVLNWCNRFVGLPVVKDSKGRDGEEVLRQGKRDVPSDK